MCTWNLLGTRSVFVEKPPKAGAPRLHTPASLRLACLQGMVKPRPWSLIQLVWGGAP